MTTTKQSGDAAEESVCEMLVDNGYTILDRNWKTRYCEIDIVAKLKQQVVFVEVKYRHSDSQGSGLDYVTHKKQQQMSFAAEMWVQAHQWAGEYCLAAVEVMGSELRVGELIFLDS